MPGTNNSLRRSLSHGEGDAPSDGTENDEMRSRALSRYHELLKADRQLQACAYDGEKVAWLSQNCGTVIEMFAGICKIYAERTAFAYCPAGSVDWQTVTYKEFWARVQAFAGGCAEVGAFKPAEFVGICGFSSLDWATANAATTYLGGTMVPLPTNISAEDVAKIAIEAELKCLVCSSAELAALTPVLASIESLRTFVVMDLPPRQDAAVEQAVAKAKDALPQGCPCYTMEALVARGKDAGSVPKMVIPGKDGHPENPLSTLLYTSGSTGLPKGAMLTEKIWHGYYKFYARDNSSSVANITLGFLPLNHMMGQFSLVQTLVTGGTVYFIRKSDMSTFFDDLRSVRPTNLMLIPRISNMLYDGFQAQLEKVQRADPSKDPAKLKQELVEHFRDVDCGGRVLTAMTGSAPTAPEVVDFLRDTLLVPIYEGYGSTEAGLMTRDGQLGDLVTEWKLIDVPELGYSVHNTPFPQGELLIKTSQMIPGYYKHPEAWEEMLDENGLMATGDVVEQRGSRLIWLDRRKNIMKLAQGEYVSVGRLEALYSGNSPLIHQIYIYGSSVRSYLLAVVVPSPEAQAKAGSPDQLKKLLRREIDDLARRKALQGYEIPRDFIVELDPFSKGNHLLTDSGKPARGKLKSKYGETMEQMYTDIEARQKERASAIRQQAAGGSIEDRVTQAVELTLGVSSAEVGDGSASFGQLGGDSLAAIQFAREVSELCGVSLPVSFVLDHSQSLHNIVEKVEQLVKGDESGAPTFARIHHGNTDTIKAADLDLKNFAPEKMPREVTEAVGVEALPAEPVGVLLTGANGFLGRFLLLELLQRTSSKEGGRVVAIVRGQSDEAAWSRLRSGFNSGDPHLKATFERLAQGRLSVYAGDLSKPNLGLAMEVYKELASSLDTVVHNGALVNHAFTYEQLYEPNVLGSLEVMKFALRYRRKALTFISSVGVLIGMDHPQPLLESEIGTTLCTEHPGGDGYAVGYGCSKWATEVQLQQIHEWFKIPISIFRCGMILAHSKALGQINTTDNFTRLLASLTYTGVAPESFYAEPNGPDHHYDGMPVDYVAESIIGISSAQRSGLAMYHMVNPHWDDNISLDTIVSWVESGGYKLKRIPDYAQWYAEFHSKLKALDHSLQNNSSLPIVYQWEHPLSGPVSKFDATQLRKGVREHTSYSDVPHLSEAFIHQNLKHLMALHVISPPEA